MFRRDRPRRPKYCGLPLRIVAFVIPSFEAVIRYMMIELFVVREYLPSTMLTVAIFIAALTLFPLYIGIIKEDRKLLWLYICSILTIATGIAGVFLLAAFKLYTIYGLPPTEESEYYLLIFLVSIGALGYNVLTIRSVHDYQKELKKKEEMNNDEYPKEDV